MVQILIVLKNACIYWAWALGHLISSQLFHIWNHFLGVIKILKLILLMTATREKFQWLNMSLHYNKPAKNQLVYVTTRAQGLDKLVYVTTRAQGLDKWIWLKSPKQNGYLPCTYFLSLGRIKDPAHWRVMHAQHCTIKMCILIDMYTNYK